MHLCIDLGSELVKCALFDEQQLVKVFKVRDLAGLKQELGTASINKGLIACTNPMKASEWEQELSSWKMGVKTVAVQDFQNHAEPDVKDLLFPDTIAKIYGALTLYPSTDCLVVDFGTTVRYELISKQGMLLGRTTFPFFDLLAEAMSIRPLVLEDEIPPALGKKPIESVDSGIYYGLLGSVERIVSEIRLSAPNPSEMITIATGTITENVSWKNPSAELVDHIHPYLVLEGLNQMMREGNK